MISSALYLLKDFVDAISEEEKQELLSFLDQDMQEILADIHALPFNPSKGLNSYEERLNAIHPSWLISLIKEHTDSDKYLLIGALSEKVHEPLFEYFKLSRRDVKVTQLAQSFITKTLYTQLIQDIPDLLPQEALPLDPLNVLVTFSREQLIELIDLLSLHDLNLELKSLISSVRLKKLQALLSTVQKQYLTQLKKKNELISFKPLGLTYWNGDTDILKKALHQRGLNRLAKALYLSHPSLQWYVLHKLDISRASIVQTLMKDLKNKAAHTHLIEQITSAASLIL